MKIRDQWGLVKEMVHPQRMQIAVTEQGSSIDEQNKESRAMVPVKTVEQWFL